VALDAKCTNIAAPLDCTLGGTTSPSKTPSTGEDALAPSYTVTLPSYCAGLPSVPRLVVKPRCTVPPAGALSSHEQSRLSAFGAPGADPSETVCTLAFTSRKVVPAQELALAGKNSPYRTTNKPTAIVAVFQGFAGVL
jgi:hypothetical protein